MARGKSITKELVAQKAIEMAKRDGIDNVTYNQLARELGIRPQSMYRYAENIREVRVIILRTFLNDMVDELRSCLKGKSPEEALQAFSSELYDLSRKQPWYYESLEVMHKYDVLQELEEPLNHLTSLVRTPIKSLKPQETDRYTQLFLATVIGYAHMNFAHFPLSRLKYDRDTYVTSMNEFIERIFLK